MMKQKKSILLVEDDYASAEMLAEMLEMSGFEVHKAATLDEAIAALSGEAFDAAVLDLTLPGVSTGEIITRVRGVVGLPPIIVFSALVVEDVRDAAEQLGAAAVLQKPARMEAILATMARVTGAAGVAGVAGAASAAGAAGLRAP